MCSTLSQKFLQRCLWNSSNVCLTDDGPLSFFLRKISSVSSFQDSLLQAIDSVMSLALCPQVASQASQHFRSFEMQATCEGCFAHQSISLVISLHSGMSRAVHPQEFSKVDVDHPTTGGCRDQWELPLCLRTAIVRHKNGSSSYPLLSHRGEGEKNSFFSVFFSLSLSVPVFIASLLLCLWKLIHWWVIPVVDYRTERTVLSELFSSTAALSWRRSVITGSFTCDLGIFF